MDLLSNEILVMILNYLDPIILIKNRTVCYAWKALIDYIIVNHKSNILLNRAITYKSAMLFVEHSPIHMLEFIQLSTNKLISRYNSVISRIIGCASKIGRNDIIKWFLNKKIPITDNIIREIAISSNVEYFNLFSEKIDVTASLYNICHDAIYNGDLHILKYIYSKYSNVFDIMSVNDICFINICHEHPINPEFNKAMCSRNDDDPKILPMDNIIEVKPSKKEKTVHWDVLEWLLNLRFHLNGPTLQCYRSIFKLCIRHKKYTLCELIYKSGNCCNIEDKMTWFYIAVKNNDTKAIKMGKDFFGEETVKIYNARMRKSPEITYEDLLI